ncbi:MAG: S8 family serine peptidase [Candidatus Thermoplasmatota archaeon]|nr:S8 family serine peptidase [Candidatus Thermoplasmatota archaeon]
MRQRTASAMVLLMLLSSLSAGLASAGISISHNPSIIDADAQQPTETTEDITSGSPWVDSSLWKRIDEGAAEVRITVITRSLQTLNEWQHANGAFEEQKPAMNGETLVADDPVDGQVDHRTFWMRAELFHKLPAVQGVIAIIDAERAPEPYDTMPFESPPEYEPESVRSGEIHGANDAWERGYTGEGMVVAIADTGVDFAHPDLNGTQARVTDSKSPYEGWPLMFDHNSMYYWLVYGDAYPARNTWYADTSLIDYDNDSDGVLDSSGYNITGVNASLSGEYHLGEHPDSGLRNKVGGDVPLLVVDDRVSGLYETVYPDINRDGAFQNDEPMRPGEETAGLDTNGDGLWDISGGLVYWISDGNNGAPYTDTYSARHGYANRIPGAGNLTLFMLESGSHGTLCASAVSAQGVISDGKVLGMAPNATISSIGNHYSGGHALDGWRFIAEGYDGVTQTVGDQPHIGSFSFGYSSVDEAGADGYSLYLDWLTRVYNQNTSYSVAIGNGGHGFGTAKVPGAAHGIFSVGAFSSRTSDSWGQNAPWSNRGPNVVGRMDPDIVSVGWSATGDIPLNYRSDANSAWSSWGGTSLATPIAAGLMALVAQAWQANLGDHPGSQEFRDFVLSTSDDRGYEPFVQGGGWFNASRATATLDGVNGTWWASPAQWNSGTFQGQHRDANINVMNPGESQVVDLEFTNYGQTDVLLRYTPTTFAPLEHTVQVWHSLGNGTEDGANDTWDGHQGDRPDLLIPLHISDDPTFRLPSETVQLRARATIEYSAFDANQDRSSEERVFLQVYRWTDDDGDGVYVEDFDNDSMVDSDDWTEGSELDEVTYWWDNGPNAEVRVGLPFEDARDGIFLGVWNYNGHLSDDPVRIEIDWTAFGSADDDWISMPISLAVTANDSSSTQMTVSVPQDARSGLHQHGVLVETFELEAGGGNTTSPISHRNWTLPVVTNVPWVGPFTLDAGPLDGNVSNQTLYTEEWISGATRWDWRAESGDWRFLSVDWPEEWDTGGTAILDVDWEDNPYTDIDIMWLSEMPHGYAEDHPDAYGESTFFIESRSINNHAGGGSHNWDTFTGTSREMFAVPASQGMHQMVLHTALHGVSTNDNPLNISVGYIAAEESGFERVVTDWAEGSGVDAVHVVSTVPLSVDSVTAYGWSQPAHFDNETAYQDVSGNKMTASWWHNMTVQNSTELNIRMNAHDDADLDLFLFRDSNEDGAFSSGEEVTRSWSGSSAETIRIVDPDDGLYSVAVHGYSVPSGTVQFWIDIEVVGGDELVITDQLSLTQGEIDAIWPNGSETLAGQVPASALQVNLAYEMPETAGIWTGFIDIIIEGDISLRLPYTYELIELDPEVDFEVPANLTQTNVTVPIRLHALDTGIGFSLDDLNWEPADEDTSVPVADLVEAIDTDGNHHNLTAIWNSGNHFAMPENVSFREVWVNATLPQVEKWHDYRADLTDRSNNSDEAHLSVSYDVTAPIVSISNIPWITNEATMMYTLQTEPGASARHGDTEIELDESGFGEFTFQLTEAEERADDDSSFFYVHGSSIFDIEVSDAAGNSFTRNFVVVFDPHAPSATLLDVTDQAGYHYTLEQMANPVNMSEGTLVVSIPVDIRDWCLRLQAVNSPHQTVQCESDSLIPQITMEDTPGQSTLISQYEINTTTLPDGDYTIFLEMTDWANNTVVEEWALGLDRSVPIVEWGISPGTDSAFFDHRQGLSWLSSEEAHVRFTIDGVLVSERTGVTSGALFELNHTGVHEVCLEAVDMTEPQENDNRFLECRSILLDPAIYSTHVTADWNGGLGAIETVEAILQRGPDQEIWWSRAETGQRHLIERGASIVSVVFDLEEGDNQFLIEIHALDHVDNYSLSIVKDTIAPALNFYEVTNRTSTLETSRVVSGVCEQGSTVMLWTEADDEEFVCPSTGEFLVTIEIPPTPGNHTINGLSVDAANNQNSMSIEVLEQEWIDWAIEDARNSGPMLWWFSLAAIALLSVTALPLTVLRRRRARRLMIEEHGPDLDEIMSEIEAVANQPVAEYGDEATE